MRTGGTRRDPCEDRGRRKRRRKGVFKGDGDRGEDLEVVASQDPRHRML